MTPIVYVLMVLHHCSILHVAMSNHTALGPSSHHSPVLCPSLGASSTADMNAVFSAETTENGSHVVATCYHGYELSGDSGQQQFKVRCSSQGQWMEEDLKKSCQRFKCTQLSDPNIEENVRMNSMDAAMCSMLHVACKPCYQLRHRRYAILTCNWPDGWSQRVDSQTELCRVQKCPPLTWELVGDAEDLSLLNVACGTTVNITCVPGSSLPDMKSSWYETTCENGRAWRPTPKKCAVRCGALHVDHGYVLDSAGTIARGVRHVWCGKNYKLNMKFSHYFQVSCGDNGLWNIPWDIPSKLCVKPDTDTASEEENRDNSETSILVVILIILVSLLITFVVLICFCCIQQKNIRKRRNNYSVNRQTKASFSKLQEEKMQDTGLDQDDKASNKIDNSDPKTNGVTLHHLNDASTNDDFLEEQEEDSIVYTKDQEDFTSPKVRTHSRSQCTTAKSEEDFIAYSKDQKCFTTPNERTHSKSLCTTAKGGSHHDTSEDVFVGLASFI